MDLEISDFELFQEPIIAKRVYIKLIELRFNESAKFEVIFFKGAVLYDMTIVKKVIVEMTGNSYMEWKNDDSYVIDYIFRELGIKRKVNVNENVSEEIIIES